MKKLSTRLSMAMLLSPCALFLAAHPAAAQTSTAAADTERVDIQRVEVTASKKKQLLLDVPYAVTAISAGEIRDRGIFDLKDMQSVVPTLTIVQNAPGQSRIQLRGLSQGQGYGAALVGTYLDDISLNMTDAQRSFDVPLVDMQRIEVLRGPQGTLYGDGSLGGTVLFITKAPNLERTEFSTELGVNHLSNGGTGFRAHAVANLPVADGTAGLRLVAGHETYPGYIDNTATGETDFNGAKRDFFRGKGLLKVNSKVDLSLLFLYADTSTDNGVFSDGNYKIAAYVPSPTTDKTGLINFVVNADLGAVKLVSSTGYIDRKLDTTSDFTAVYRAAFPASLQAVLLPKPNSGGGYRQNIDMKITTQELRLESLTPGPLSWTAGAYYRKTDSQSITSDVFTDYGGRIQGGFDGTAPTNVDQIALFGEATYALSSAWSVMGGLRAFREKSELVGSKLPSSLSPPTTPSTIYDDHQTFRKTTPRINVLWRYSPAASAYANASRGFRSGGFNAAVTPRTYGPEDITTYELGNKASVLGGAFQYDVALYYSKYNNVQAQDLAPGCTPATCRATTVNTGRASGPGVDVALSALLTKGLTVDLTLGYSDLTYDVTTQERSKGDALNFIPKKTAGLAANYRFAWASGWPGLARLDYQHSDAYKIINRSTNLSVSSDAVNTVNARLGIEMPRWQAYLEGRNLNNFHGVVNPGFSGIPDVHAVPRSIGVTLRNQF